ncbi:hypothetical protein RB200_36145 [Streptomyces sp. PmtG]
MTREDSDLHEGDDVDLMTDHDTITQTVFNQGDDTFALTDGETFDWPVIESEWSYWGYRRDAGQRGNELVLKP